MSDLFAAPVKRPLGPVLAPRRPAAAADLAPAPRQSSLRGPAPAVAVTPARSAAGAAAEARLEREADETGERLARRVGDRPRRSAALGALPPAAPPGAGAPGPVLDLIRSSGRPLPAALRGRFEDGLGIDLSAVRIHAGARADAAAASLGALAFTYGRDIAFRAGHYAPDTQAGRRLLGHELAHVVQQSGGPARVQRQEDPEGKKARLARRYFAVKIDGKLSAEELKVEFIRQYRGVSEAKARALAKNWHWGTEPKVTDADVANKQFLVDVTYVSMPPIATASKTKAGSVVSDETKAAASGSQAETDKSKLKRQAFDALPEDVRTFLFEGGGEPEPEELDTVLAIAAKVAAMTPEQRAEYKGRVAGETADWKAYRKSLESFLAELMEREAERAELAAVTARLEGLDALYGRYRQFGESAVFTMAPPINTGGIPTMPLTPPESKEKKALKTELVAAGFPDGIAGFETALKDYEKAFAREAARRLEIALDQYLHFLMQEKKRYGATTATGDLFAAVGATGAAFDYQQADEADLAGGSMRVKEAQYERAAEYAAKSDAASLRAATKLLGLAGDHPLVGQPGFDLKKLARATDQNRLRKLVLDDIRERVDAIAKIKEKLGDPMLIFGNEEIFAKSLVAQGVADKPLLVKILNDHRDQLAAENLVKDISFTILGIILGILTEGGGFIALAASGTAVGLSIKDVVSGVDKFQLDKASNKVGLVSDEPTIAWLAIDVGGMFLDVLDFGKALKTAPNLFKKTKTGGKARDGAEAPGLAGARDEMRLTSSPNRTDKVAKTTKKTPTKRDLPSGKTKKKKVVTKRVTTDRYRSDGKYPAKKTKHLRGKKNIPTRKKGPVETKKKVPETTDKRQDAGKVETKVDQPPERLGSDVDRSIQTRDESPITAADLLDEVTGVLGGIDLAIELSGELIDLVGQIVDAGKDETADGADLAAAFATLREQLQESRTELGEQAFEDLMGLSAEAELLYRVGDANGGALKLEEMAIRLKERRDPE